MLKPLGPEVQKQKLIVMSVVTRTKLQALAVQFIRVYFTAYALSSQYSAHYNYWFISLQLRGKFGTRMSSNTILTYKAPYWPFAMHRGHALLLLAYCVRFR